MIQHQISHRAIINFYNTRFHYQTDREMDDQLTHLLCAEGNWFKCDFTCNRKKTCQP